MVPPDPSTVAPRPIRLLLIDDDRLVSDFILKIFQRFASGNEVESFTDPVEGLNAAKSGRFDVVVTDLKMPQISGLEIMRQLHASNPQLPVILMTGYGTSDVAIEAGKLGVHEFLSKPFTPEQLVDAVESAAETYRIAAEPVVLGPDPSEGRALAGRSKVIQDLSLQIGKVAGSPLPVLIHGPTGSGKELVARAIHQYSERSSRPFLLVNCAAGSDSELEAELFGLAAGALQSSAPQRVGKLEQAQGGTVLLDEVGELSFALQAKLLGVLQQGEIQRIGSSQPVPVDVRILATTRYDMAKLVEEKRFREDLYFRLRVVAVEVPGLSTRIDDIPLLAEYFISRHAARMGFPRASITLEAASRLRDMPWPGNVRQLENFTCELILLAREHPITPAHVEQASGKTAAESAHDLRFGALVARELRRAQSGEIPSALPVLMAAVEQEIYGQAYQLTNGNRSRMSRLLGVSRPTVLDKIAQYNLGQSPAS